LGTNKDIEIEKFKENINDCTFEMFYTELELNLLNYEKE